MWGKPCVAISDIKPIENWRSWNSVQREQRSFFWGSLAYMSGQVFSDVTGPDVTGPDVTGPDVELFLICSSLFSIHSFSKYLLAESVWGLRFCWLCDWCWDTEKESLKSSPMLFDVKNVWFVEGMLLFWNAALRNECCVEFSSIQSPRKYVD